MADYMDFYNVYIIGSGVAQILFGFYFFARLLQDRKSTRLNSSH